MATVNTNNVTLTPTLPCTNYRYPVELHDPWTLMLDSELYTAAILQSNFFHLEHIFFLLVTSFLLAFSYHEH